MSCFFLLNGCITVYQNRSTPPTPPPPPLPVWVVYLPTPEIPPNGTIRPIPAHQGWTNLRMERDLERMAQAKITAALVMVTHIQLLDESFHERYRKFAELAEIRGIQVALLLTSLTSHAPALERSNIALYLSEQGLTNFPSSLRNETGIPLLVVTADFVLDAPQDEHDQTTCIWQLGHDLPALPSGPLDVPAMRPDARGVLWIRAADNSGCAVVNRGRPTDDWTIRRREGAALKRQLEQARSVGAKLLLLDSWNNYSRGSFVEPNSNDQNACMSILQNR
ncbi:MAG: hypothetical protein IKS83_00125 [Victivallales bacterium]|nr:hypothetical protein [Victivallales bacterium]